jgi:hypothetical protein
VTGTRATDGKVQRVDRILGYNHNDAGCTNFLLGFYSTYYSAGGLREERAYRDPQFEHRIEKMEAEGKWRGERRKSGGEAVRKRACEKKKNQRSKL